MTLHPQNASSAPGPSGEKPIPLRIELFRALALILVATALGILTNAFSSRSLSILDSEGPGAPPKPQPAQPLDGFSEALRAGKLLILDARAESLLAEGKPLGALRVTPDAFDDEYPKLKPYLDSVPLIVVLCDSAECSTSGLIVKQLRDLGHKQAKVFPGGWRKYREAGYPLETRP